MEGYEVKVLTQPGGVRCDFETAKRYLQERLGEYDSIMFTEDTRKQAKESVAQLRKEKKQFSDAVKSAKAEYMKPFEEFVEQAETLITMYDTPIRHITAQLNDFEEKRIREKQALVEQLYLECIDDMSDVIPLSSISNPKWLNATTSAKSIREEMMKVKEQVKSGVQAIREMGSDAEEKALAMFYEDRDVSKAVQYISQYEQRKAEIEARERERVRQEEIERIRREEREKLEAEEQRKAELLKIEEEKEALLRAAEEEKAAAVEAARQEAAQEVIDSLIPDEEGEKFLMEIRMLLSKDQKEKLLLYMDSVGIDWEYA